MTKVLFQATDASGPELWITDGTNTGTALFKEINTGSPGGANPFAFTLLDNGKVIFSANDKPWLTDGTPEGTILLKDIILGWRYYEADHPSFTKLENGKIIFSTESENGRTQLWITDGTQAGTSLLHDLGHRHFNNSFTLLGKGKAIFLASVPEDSDVLAIYLTDGTLAGTQLLKGINSDVFFLHYGDITYLGNGKAIVSGDQGVWISDGTAKGTIKLHDDFCVAQFSLGNGKSLLWTENEFQNNELWVTDGSKAGTILLDDRILGYNVFILANHKAIYVRSSGLDDRELWITDGTTTGKTLLNLNYDTYQFGQELTGFTSLDNGNVLFYSKMGSSNGLWVTDGTPEGTVLLKNFSITDSTSQAKFFQLGNGKALFSANDGINGEELWITDGTSSGTLLIKDINAGASNSDPRGFALLDNGHVIFSANDGVHGDEPWITDGTLTGTVLLKDVNTSTVYTSLSTFDFSLNLSLNGFTLLGNGKALFVADEQLWITDGTESATKQLMEHYQTSLSRMAFASLGGGKAIFQASDMNHGNELWITDGTQAGTTILRDINPGQSNSSPHGFISLDNGKALFQAYDEIKATDLWVTDGTSVGTTLLRDINPGHFSDLRADSFISLGNNKVIFFVNGSDVGSYDNGLWCTDGTSEGTKLLKNISGELHSTRLTPNGFTLLGNGTAIFTPTSHDVDGYSHALWITDGTSAGTIKLKDINGGENEGPSDFTLLNNGNVIFWADGGSSSNGLWSTDGTIAGTTFLKNIKGDQDSVGVHQIGFTLLGNHKAIFLANDNIHGDELWITDGTSVGTTLLKDINAGSGHSAPSGFTLLGNGKVIFTANDGISGYEPWISDGTLEGTVLLKDIYSGASSSYGTYFHKFIALANGKAIFIANDGVNGRELWITDGTSIGTFLLKDINIGANYSNPVAFTLLDRDHVLFQANDGIHGEELWITDGTSAGTRLVNDINKLPSSSNSVEFTLLDNNSNHAPILTNSIIQSATLPITSSIRYSGSFLFTDADLSDTHTILPALKIGNAGGKLITSIKEDSGSGQIDWVYQYKLPKNFGSSIKNKIDNFDVSLNDGHGNIVNQKIAFNIVIGTKGNDNLIGTLDTNILLGGDGKDQLIGSLGNDALIGGAGVDNLDGGKGADILVGGKGNDDYVVEDAGDIVSENRNSGIDTVLSHINYNLIDTDGSENKGGNVENLRLMGSSALNATGNALNNLIFTNSGDNVIDGGDGIDTVSYLYEIASVTVNLGTSAAQATVGSGSDTLVRVENISGSNFDDTLIGSNSKNILVGGLGKDTITGNDGKDVFDFNDFKELSFDASLTDIITDFNTGDKIDLSTLDANTATKANNAFKGFISNSAAFKVAGQLKFDDVNHILYGNTDTDEAPEFSIVLIGVTHLSVADFFL